jgi:hypothetical protein
MAVATGQAEHCLFWHLLTVFFRFFSIRLSSFVAKARYSNSNLLFIIKCEDTATIFPLSNPTRQFEEKLSILGFEPGYAGFGNWWAISSATPLCQLITCQAGSAGFESCIATNSSTPIRQLIPCQAFSAGFQSCKATNSSTPFPQFST